VSGPERLVMTNAQKPCGECGTLVTTAVPGPAPICLPCQDAADRAELVEHARLQRTRMDQARSAAEYWQAAERFAMDVEKLLPELKQPEGS